MGRKKRLQKEAVRSGKVMAMVVVMASLGGGLSNIPELSRSTPPNRRWRRSKKK